MTKKTLYRNGNIVTPNEPEAYDSTLLRLIADDGMILTNGAIYAPVIDVESADGWIEEADSTSTEETEDGTSSTTTDISFTSNAESQLEQIKEVYKNEL